MNHKLIKKYMPLLFIILAACLLVNGIFLVSEAYDNKYRVCYSPDEYGHVAFPDGWFEEHKTTPLVTGWQWKTGDTESFTPTYIGQYGSFAKGDRQASPYGQAVYRISISTPMQPEPYLLLLPEVFSACEVRINGDLVRTLGNVNAAFYKPLVKNILVSVPAGKAELQITAANYTHYYSGVTYPPVLGTADAVEGLVIRQLILYGFLCFFSLGAAVISIAFWVTHKRRQLYLLYGLMTVCFSVYISYPLTRYLGISAVRLFYALEDSAYYGIVLCMVLMTQLLTGNVGKRGHEAAAAVSLFFCVLPALTSFLLAPMVPQWVNLSGYLIHGYKLAVSIYLIILSLQGLFRSRQAGWLLFASLVFGAGVLRDFQTAGTYEPVYGLWQTEYTSCLIVITFMSLVIRHYRILVGENQRLSRHMAEEVEKKTEYLTVLLNERRQLLSGIAHDMKAPIAVIRAYIDLIRLGNVQIDPATEKYISVIDLKSNSLAEQLDVLQSFNQDNTQAEPPITCPLTDFLSCVRDETRMYADAAGIYYQMEIPHTDALVRIQKARLLHALENIVLNATEHTPAGGTVEVKASVGDSFSVGAVFSVGDSFSVSDGFSAEGKLPAAGDAAAEDSQAVITITDTGCGIPEEDLPRIFDYHFSGKQAGESPNIPRGIGLYFARTAIVEHGGTIEVRSKVGKGTTFVVTLPLAAESAYEDCV